MKKIQLAGVVTIILAMGCKNLSPNDYIFTNIPESYEEVRVEEPMIERENIQLVAAWWSNEDELAEQKRNYITTLAAQMIEAEAGNQPLLGRRLVADVIYNRIDSDIFPNTIEEVLFQKYQFSPIGDGRFYEMEGHISEESWVAAVEEYDKNTRVNTEILYFCSLAVNANGKNPFKVKDMWFAY